MCFVWVSDCFVKVLYYQVDVIVVCKVECLQLLFYCGSERRPVGSLVISVGSFGFALVWCVQCVMCMGKWLEGRAWDVCQVDRRAMLGEASEISGDVLFVLML